MQAFVDTVLNLQVSRIAGIFILTFIKKIIVSKGEAGGVQLIWYSMLNCEFV